jgi:SPP1 gp7 family putative phage head morphogenesis protein
MSTSQYLIDAATRHQVFIQRYAGGRSNDAAKMLDRLRRQLLGRLADDPTDFQIMRLKATLAEIDAIAAATFDEWKKDFKPVRDDFVISEADFTASLLTNGTSASFVVPSTQSLVVGAETVAFDVGSERLTVDQALQAFGDKKRKEITQLISDGVLLGDTTQQVSKTLRDKINTLYKHQADALVRTSVNHLSNVARMETYKANADLLEGYEFVATLDSRTTIICGSNDGQVFEHGRGPMPPLHWNCRSTTIPKVKKEYDLGADIAGKRPSKGSSGPKLVSGRETYSGWLKRQSDEFQDEALGPERAKLFRAGEIGLTGFVDPTGRVYTLNELKATGKISLE